MSNQWPDFARMPKPKTIRSVVLEEGRGISERTDGRMIFDVDSSPKGKGGFEHSCYLVVPTIAYRYPLMRVVQESPGYPVRVFADNWETGISAANDSELRDHLGEVFRSEATKSVVFQLLDAVS